MSEFMKAEALAFIESMRLTLVNRVGFRWMVEKLSGLAAYIETITAENERLNAYLDWANARDDYESYRAKYPDAAIRGNAREEG
jgi:hypothetical protein